MVALPRFAWSSAILRILKLSLRLSQKQFSWTRSLVCLVIFIKNLRRLHVVTSLMNCLLLRSVCIYLRYIVLSLSYTLHGQCKIS